MNSRIELGRVAGIPIYLDMMFVLVMLVFGHRYFTSGDTQLMSIGLVIVAGLLLSILLHELGHAFAARMFKVGVREIELTGLGGLAHFSTSLPRSAIARSIIFLAGPAANLLLWLGLGWLTTAVAGLGKPAAVVAIATLASANFYLLVFNLLPAFPLDGGRTLEAWLEPILGTGWAIRIVSVLGLVVTAGCIWWALPANIFMLFLAFILFQANWSALESVRGRGGR